MRSPLSEKPPENDERRFDGTTSGMVRARTRHQRHLATTARLHALRASNGDEAHLFTRVTDILTDSFAAKGAAVGKIGDYDLPLGQARFERDDSDATRLRMFVQLSDGELLQILIEQPYHALERELPSEDLRDALAHFEELGRVLVDVLDAERTLTRLRLREAELSSMLGAMPDILTIVDTNGTIVGFHNGDERHDLDGANIVGKHLAELVPAEVWRGAMPVWQRAILTRRMQEHRYSVELDGRTLHFVSRAQAYGDPLRVLWHTRDVTEERRLQEKLLSIQRFEGIALLASALAHDFSNLLTGILGNAEFARLEVGAGTGASDALSDVISAARRASELCQQLLGMSGKRRFSLGFVNVSILCEEMLVILRTSIGRRVTVVRELTDAAKMPVLIGDAIQLRQIVLNLLSNASDAIGDEGGTITVRTGLVPMPEDDEGHWAFLEVEDNGRGMDEIARRRLLQPFISVPLETRELGLAATFGIVRGHGGTVEVGAALSGGTRVRVMLPLERDLDASADESAITEEVLAPMLHRGGLVLVVTTDPTLVASCRRQLEQAGHRVQHIASGEEALIALRAIVGLVRGIVLDAEALGPNTTALAMQIQAVVPNVPRLVLGDPTHTLSSAPLADASEDNALHSLRPLTSETLARAIARLISKL